MANRKGSGGGTFHYLCNTHSIMETEPIIEESSSDMETSERKEAKHSRDVRISKRSAVIFAAVVILLALAYSSRGVFVAAVVNGAPISRLSVVEQLEKKGGKSTLDMLIVQKLLADEVKKKGIVVSDDDINAEITTIEGRFTAQGTTLDAALASQGLTRDDVKKQVITQVQVEKLLGDKAVVSDDEVDQYITTSKIQLPKTGVDTIKAQIKAQLKQQKVAKEGNAFVGALQSSAKISYWAKY